MPGLSIEIGIELSSNAGAQSQITYLSASTNALPETTSGGAVAATLSIIGDDYVAPASFTIISDPSGLFEIVGNELLVKSGVTFDYETTLSYPIIIEGTDGAPNTYSNTAHVPITNINEAPLDISLSATAILEDAVIGDTIAVISSSGDPDGGDTATYSITNDPDNKFLISGTDLKLSGALDYATSTSHNVTIRVTDGGSLFYEELFTIDVTDVSSFDINALPSLFFNLDSKLSTIITSTGSQVSEIDDLGSGDNDGTQPTSSMQPLTGGSLNGLNALSFDGTNDKLIVPDTTVDDFSFFLALSQVDAAVGVPFSNGKFVIYFSGNSLYIVSGTGGACTHTFSDNTPVVVGVVGSSTGAGSFYVNGSTAGGWAGGTSPQGGVAGLGWGTIVGQAVEMKFGQAVYCTEQLSAQNIADLQTELMNEWVL